MPTKKFLIYNKNMNIIFSKFVQNKIFKKK